MTSSPGRLRPPPEVVSASVARLKQLSTLRVPPFELPADSFLEQAVLDIFNILYATEIHLLSQAVADRLVDQCMVGLDEALKDECGLDFADTPKAILDEIDSLVFLCDDCGWWCSTDELNNDDGQRRCDDCVGDD